MGLALETWWESKASFAQGRRSLLVNIGSPLYKDVVHCELSCILGSSDSSTVPNIEHQRFKEPVRSEQQHHIQSVVRFLVGSASVVWAVRQTAEWCRNFPSGVSLQSQVVTILIEICACVICELFLWKCTLMTRSWQQHAACGSTPESLGGFKDVHSMESAFLVLVLSQDAMKKYSEKFSSCSGL